MCRASFSNEVCDGERHANKQAGIVLCVVVDCVWATVSVRWWCDLGGGVEYPVQYQLQSEHVSS